MSFIRLPLIRLGPGTLDSQTDIGFGNIPILSVGVMPAILSQGPSHTPHLLLTVNQPAFLTDDNTLTMVASLSGCPFMSSPESIAPYEDPTSVGFVSNITQCFIDMGLTTAVQGSRTAFSRSNNDDLPVYDIIQMVTSSLQLYLFTLAGPSSTQFNYVALDLIFPGPTTTPDSVPSSVWTAPWPTDTLINSFDDGQLHARIVGVFGSRIDRATFETLIPALATPVGSGFAAEIPPGASYMLDDTVCAVQLSLSHAVTPLAVGARRQNAQDLAIYSINWLSAEAIDGIITSGYDVEAFQLVPLGTFVCLPGGYYLVGKNSDINDGITPAALGWQENALLPTSIDSGYAQLPKGKGAIVLTAWRSHLYFNPEPPAPPVLPIDTTVKLSLNTLTKASMQAAQLNQDPNQ